MISTREAFGMIGPYLKRRVMDQVKAVWLIILYLIAFQSIVLGIPLQNSFVIGCGLGLVVMGLTLFMEGLTLGLMPLGEALGLKLPQKAKLPLILGFAFLMGIGATFAEPAIGVLKMAGSSVKPWDAPLLFVLLNRHADMLVYAVGFGVGLAVVFGMLRFIYHWSLKPFIYVLISVALGFTVWSFFDPNMAALTGLAWDCGAVTTGPVTVPLVLALGIGICRVVSSGKSDGGGGFGVVTLASLFPVLAVFLLGSFHNTQMPEPMSQEQFFSEPSRVAHMFETDSEFEKLKNAHSDSAAESNSAAPVSSNIMKTIKDQGIAATKAIIPLSLFLLVFLVFVLREKLPRPDEIALGVTCALLGMWVFNLGIELGLSKIGDQVGSNLPASYQEIAKPEQDVSIERFDPSLLQKSIATDGSVDTFFYTKKDNRIVAVPFEDENLNSETGTYKISGSIGPLFGANPGSLLGLSVVILFAFLMGYGATLAEPALNALGNTVEEITVGTFRKSLLMQSVALGVGVGIAVGVAKIIWNIPLAYILVPPYVLLLVVTFLSTEEFVNIGWDSAGVTTGPITVPLVLALGLGIGSQAGVVEGFGVLSMASVCPILSVLLVGMVVSRKRKQAHAKLEQSVSENDAASQLNTKKIA